MAESTLNVDGGEEIRDEKLVELIVQGDEAAFELLYERYFKRIYRFAFSRLRNREDAEETVQEVFIAVFASIGSFRGDASLIAWVLGVTRRTIASRFKKKRLAMVPFLGDEDPEATELVNPTAQRQPSPLEMYEYNERVAQLEDLATNELSAEQRRIFELHHLEEHSIRSLAESLSKSQDAVKSTLYRTRKILLAAG